MTRGGSCAPPRLTFALGGILKILIVDDSEVVLEATAASLRRAGFDVVTTSNPLLVAALLRTERPDVLLLDVDMPALKGPQVVSALRAADCLAETLVLLHSASHVSDLGEVARACGAAGAISKVAGERELVAQLQRIGRRSSSGANEPGGARALVVAGAELERQVLSALEGLSIHPTPRGSVFLESVLRAERWDYLILESAAVTSAEALLKRLRARKLLEATAVVIVGRSGGDDVALDVGRVDRYSLGLALRSAQTRLTETRRTRS